MSVKKLIVEGTYTPDTSGTAKLYPVDKVTMRAFDSISIFARNTDASYDAYISVYVSNLKDPDVYSTTATDWTLIKTKTVGQGDGGFYRMTAEFEWLTLVVTAENDSFGANKLELSVRGIVDN